MPNSRPETIVGPQPRPETTFWPYPRPETIVRPNPRPETIVKNQSRLRRSWGLNYGLKLILPVSLVWSELGMKFAGMKWLVPVLARYLLMWKYSSWPTAILIVSMTDWRHFDGSKDTLSDRKFHKVSKFKWHSKFRDKYPSGSGKRSLIVTIFESGHKH